MNFINNYLKGKLQLVYTFWSSFGFYIIVSLFEKVLRLSKTNTSFYIFIDCIAVILIIISLIAVWNSSKNYLINKNNNVLWGYLAKIYVIVIFALLILGFISGFVLGFLLALK
jgi:hypothetical protein